MNIVKARGVFHRSHGRPAGIGTRGDQARSMVCGPGGNWKTRTIDELMAVLGIVAGGGIGTGLLVKYVAEYRADPPKLRRLLGAAWCYALVASCAIGGLAALFSRPLTVWLLGDGRFRSLILVLAVAQVAIAASNYAIAVINGFMDLRRVATVYVAGSVLGIAATATLAYFFRLNGALFGFVFGQAALLAISVPMLRSSPYFERRRFFRLRFDREMTVRLGRFSVMTVTSALVYPLVTIAVRNQLASRFSWQAVGNWQGRRQSVGSVPAVRYDGGQFLLPSPSFRRLRIRPCSRRSSTRRSSMFSPWSECWPASSTLTRPRPDEQNIQWLAQASTAFPCRS